MKACVSDEVIARKRSPSGQFEAVVHEVNGGATTEFGYNMQVRRRGLGWYPGGRNFFVGDSLVRSDCENGVDLRWLGDRRLEISFASGSRYDEDYPRKIVIDGKDIEIVITPGAKKPSESCLQKWAAVAAEANLNRPNSR